MTPIDTADLDRLDDILRDPLSGLTWDNRIMAADAIREVLALRKAEADLISVLRQTAAILLAEKNRSGGQPFSGIWSMPALGIRATVDETLDAANELLGHYLPTTPEAEGGSDA